MQFSTQITISNRIVTLSIPRESLAWRKANSIFVPLGPCWSTATFCMSKREVDIISAQSADTLHPIVWKQVSQNDDGSPNGAQSRTLTFSGWRFLRASRVLPGGKDDPSSLYMAEFVDARYIAEHATSSDANRSKLRSYAHHDDFLTNPSALDTWSNLVSKLWIDVGVLGSFPGLPGTLPIDGEPEGHWLIGLNGWRALCAVLDQLDCAVAHNPLNNNTYTIVQLGAEQDIPDQAERLQWDAQPSLSNIHCAATCRVHFYYHRKAYGQERDTELATNWTVVGASDVIDKTTNINGATGTKFLWDDLSWVLDETSINTNAGALDTRATNRKDRYVTRQTVGAKRRIYSGLLSDYVVGSQIRAVIWRNFGNEEADNNDFGGTCTEFVAGPHLAQGYKDGGVVWFDKQLVTPENEQYGPPDYGRHSYANFPRLPNIVQVFDQQFNPGEMITPTESVSGTFMHHGRVKRWVNNAMESPDTPLLCWILFVDDYDNLLGSVSAKNYEYYGPARLCGVSTLGGVRRPVYMVKANEQPLVFFEIRENKDLGTIGNTAAEILAWNGSDWVGSGTNIIIDDWYRGATDATAATVQGFFTGKADMDRGWGKLYKYADPEDEGDLDHYVVIWMSGPAHITEFVLLADRTPGEAGAPPLSQLVSATVFRTYLYGHEFYAQEGEEIQVRFPPAYFPFAKTGAKGTAIYDDQSINDREYRVVQSDQLCLTAVAVLDADLCGAGTANVSEFANATPYPFSQIPPGATGSMSVLNLFKHRGIAGDLVFLAFIQYLEEYCIIDIEKKNFLVIEPYEVVINDQGMPVLRTYGVTAAIEYCEEPAAHDLEGDICQPLSGGSGP